MTDVLLITHDDFLDLEIEDGFPLYLPEDASNNDQRACVSAFMVQGTVPGALDTGVDWSMLMEGKESLIQLDNSIRRNIESNGGTYGTSYETYVPIYFNEAGNKLGVNVIKIGGDK